MKRIAVILAGGIGNRIGGECPKQFLIVSGKPVLCYTIEAFEQCPFIDEICIVSNKDWITETEKIVRLHDYHKIRHIIKGGRERSDSSMAVFAVYHNPDDILLFHDAARPLVNQRIITENINAMQHTNAAGTAIPTTDTIWQVDDTEEYIYSIPNRQVLWRAQTPQTFRLGTIKQAYMSAIQDPDFRASDDCGVLKKYLPEEPIKIVLGEETNFKITYPNDIRQMEMLVTTQTNLPI